MNQDAKTYLVVEQTPLPSEAKKPTELITIRGHEELTLMARRSITLLWHNAHVQGIQTGKDYTIPLSDLMGTSHKGTDNIQAAILSLMKTVVTVQRADGSITQAQLLGGNDISDIRSINGVLTYSFDRRIVEILKSSTIWGKISFPVLLALTSKYAITLYENVAQLAGLDYKTSQVYTLEEFRKLLGVEPGKYAGFGELNKHVIKKAALEINALAPFNINIQPRKTGRSVTHIRLGWWPKELDEVKKAFKELQQPRVGRSARIKDEVCWVLEPVKLSTDLK